ncbi:thioredoxin-dependent thiol peroxidase [bacterium]|nr:thioredoxin-dependent thiol peroxidase [bacterium]
MSDDLTGKPAPDFALPDAQGETRRLADFAGKKVVLYFYPKDDTPGCTAESCRFRDMNADFKNANTVIVGVSRDGAESHRRFADKYDLPFLLLTDADASVHNAYGAWGMRTKYGKTSEGVIRSTFLIDENGNVARQWRNVKVDGHGDAVLRAALGEA